LKERRIFHLSKIHKESGRRLRWEELGDQKSMVLKGRGNLLGIFGRLTGKSWDPPWQAKDCLSLKKAPTTSDRDTKNKQKKRVCCGNRGKKNLFC